MKFKIIIIMLILFFCVNIVSGEILDEGVFHEETYESFNCTSSGIGGGGNTGFESIDVRFSENFQSGLQYLYTDIPSVLFAGTVKGTYDSYFENIELSESGTPVASGKIGYYKLENGYYRIWLWFDLSTWSYTGTGIKKFDFSGHTRDYYKVNSLASTWNTGTQPYHLVLSLGTTHFLQGEYSMDITYTFKNTYYTTKNDNTMHNIFIDKTIVGYTCLSKIKITDSLGAILLNETSYNINDLEISYYNSNTPYLLECENSVKTSFSDYLYFLSKEDLTSCRIDVDDIEIGENINASYFNIDDLRENPIKYGNIEYETCDINLQIIVDRGYYEELIYQDLITDELDNTFSYSSIGLSNGIYFAQINKVSGGLNDYAVKTPFIISEPSNYSILVYPDNVYIGENINIIYKSLNQSIISLYDNNSNLIKSWLGIQGDNQKIYQIPIDESYINSYPNWFIYLNDTGNSSNYYRYNFSVNWKVYVEIEPTPEPTEPYYNVTIEENIKEIKDGLDPLKELIFGFSTIFVDNPDYNKDNIVDVNEISTWLNSLISIAIIIFLYILYKVYKRK